MFHCPLKPDAVQTIKMLNDSSHRCIMITGDNPLTASHVARDVEIVDRDVLILDVREGSKDEAGECHVFRLTAALALLCSRLTRLALCRPSLAHRR